MWKAGAALAVVALAVAGGLRLRDAPAAPTAVILAAGDIASCGSTGAAETARLLARLPGTVLTLGDEAYPDGRAGDFASCYHPTWGRFLSRTRPAPGNHEYRTADAGGYFDYFGRRANDRGKGWYSFDLGRWHVIALNTNGSAACQAIPCSAGSAQERWLRADLARSHARCTLAYWHHPRFSSGSVHGDSREVRPLWNDLYAAGADVVLAAHDHDYERFAPQTPAGRADAKQGIREFVVGTGGASHYDFGKPAANSEVRDNTTYGVLQLKLQPSSYSWRFVPVAGGAFTDSGHGGCH